MLKFELAKKEMDVKEAWQKMPLHKKIGVGCVCALGIVAAGVLILGAIGLGEENEDKNDDVIDYVDSDSVEVVDVIE